MAKRTKTDLSLSCPCGAKSPVFQTRDSRWYSHCVNCGRLTFWSNPMLSERLRYGGILCHDKLDAKDCKWGKTSFCRVCRIRVFMPTGY